MRATVAAQPGVVKVADLFAVVVGPLSLVVDGEVTCESGLDVSGVEQVIGQAVTALRERWPMIKYIYLMPVPASPSSRPGRFRGSSPAYQHR
jgi:divalent metal cation (Fe/Co/Zn/Cd) transporter